MRVNTVEHEGVSHQRSAGLLLHDLFHFLPSIYASSQIPVGLRMRTEPKYTGT